MKEIIPLLISVGVSSSIKKIKCENQKVDAYHKRRSKCCQYETVSKLKAKREGQLASSKCQSIKLPQAVTRLICNKSNTV
jgi:hypothetical protein